MPEEPHPAWLLAECFMKPVVCYAVAAKPFATPGRTAIAELLAIGSGGYFRVRDQMALARVGRNNRRAPGGLGPLRRM